MLKYHFQLLLAASSYLSAAQAQSAAQNATAFALLYGYPLLAYEKLVPALLKYVGVNEILHARQLRDVSDKSVVKPNVDTIYSEMVYDLSENDLTITIPEVSSDQYILVSYYDPFGDNFANTGTGYFDTPGDYLLRRTQSNDSSGNGVQNDTSQYVAFINSPTTYGVFLIRWLYQNTSSYSQIHYYQDKCRATAAPRAAKTHTSPPLEQIQQQNITGAPAQAVMKLLAVYEPNNPSEVASQAATVVTELEMAGVSKGVYTSNSAVNITQANNTAVMEAAAAAVAPGARTPLGNGWSVASLTGDFGSNYGVRAAVASSGYLQLKAPGAIYPSWSNGSGSSRIFDLGADESYLYTFSAKPPLQRLGFWSLTAYDPNYLIPNPINVYALGDRSNLTYSDGSKIYGPDAASSDGTFQILVQPADVTPPSNWTNNWLPGAEGGGNMTLTLRWYGATDALTNGSWVYPIVTKQAALKSGNGSVSSPAPSSTPSSASSSAPSAAPSAAPSTGIATREPARSMFVLALVLAVGCAVFM